MRESNLMIGWSVCRPHGAVPLVLAVCSGCALLLRDPKVMAGVGILSFFVGWYNVQQML